MMCLLTQVIMPLYTVFTWFILSDSRRGSTELYRVFAHSTITNNLQIKQFSFHPCDLLMSIHSFPFYRAHEIYTAHNEPPARKELAPFRLINYLSVVKRCPCWVHTMYKNNSRNSSKQEHCSPHKT